jgi:AcrR family transcriptional regulator
MPRVRLADVVRKLPRRAHDLPRRTVEASQRWRILEAMTEVTAKRGYGDASIADVIAAAGVSRKTFYESFRDKEDCFLTAYDVVSERLIESLVVVSAAHTDPALRQRAQVVAFLEALARDPTAARVFMVDVLGAGPRALRRRDQINRRFADTLLGGIVDDPIRRAAIIGGVNNVVAGALLEGSKAEQLRALGGPLSDFVQAALGLSRRARRRGRDRYVAL